MGTPPLAFVSSIDKIRGIQDHHTQAERVSSSESETQTVRGRENCLRSHPPESGIDPLGRFVSREGETETAGVVRGAGT